jgi:hypothetical protein
MAHAAHAANQFTFENGGRDVKNWQRDANGFGTTICLEVNKQQLTDTVKRAQQLDLMANLTVDPEYGYVVSPELFGVIDISTFTAKPIAKDNGLVMLFRHELTCGYVFISDDSPHREDLFKDLPLYP